MNFTLTPKAIALCVILFAGEPSPCHDGAGGLTWFQIATAAIARGPYDSHGGCPITLKGTVTAYCPPPAGKDCFVLVRYSAPPAFPNGVVYLCRDVPVS